MAIMLASTLLQIFSTILGTRQRHLRQVLRGPYPAPRLDAEVGGRSCGRVVALTPISRGGNAEGDFFVSSGQDKDAGLCRVLVLQ